jgi:beta-lactam-binding protein with PASTA domain
MKRLLGFLLKNALLLLALLATAGSSALLTMRSLLEAQEVQVPALTGRRLPEAGALTARLGLQLRVEGKRHSPEVPPDRVAAQEPPAGAGLKANRSVRVWLSLGPERVVVPAVEGQSLRSARLSLGQSLLPLARVVAAYAPAPAGTVLMQRPPAGEAEMIGPGVSLLVSRGPAGRDYLMPDLIGRQADAVVDALQQRGFRLAVRPRSYPGVAAGIVLRQSPAAGHRLSPGAEVALEINAEAPR